MLVVNPRTCQDEQKYIEIVDDDEVAARVRGEKQRVQHRA